MVLPTSQGTRCSGSSSMRRKGVGCEDALGFRPWKVYRRGELAMPTVSELTTLHQGTPVSRAAAWSVARAPSRYVDTSAVEVQKLSRSAHPLLGTFGAPLALSKIADFPGTLYCATLGQCSVNAAIVAILIWCTSKTKLSPLSPAGEGSIFRPSLAARRRPTEWCTLRLPTRSSCRPVQERRPVQYRPCTFQVCLSR